MKLPCNPIQLIRNPNANTKPKESLYDNNFNPINSIPKEMRLNYYYDMGLQKHDCGKHSAQNLSTYHLAGRLLKLTGDRSDQSRQIPFNPLPSGSIIETYIAIRAGVVKNFKFCRVFLEFSPM